MQYVMLLILVFGLISFALMIYSAIRKAGRSKVLMYGVVSLLMIVSFVWYLSPAQYQLKEDADITIIYTAKDTTIKPDYNQTAELVSHMNDLYFKRQFFNGYEHLRFNNDEYVYVLITQAAKEQVPIGLHMTLNEAGFTHGKGFCFDNRYAEIMNAQALIQYVKSLLQET